MNPTNATQAKDRLYSQLASSFGRMNRALSQTAGLCESLQVDLEAMRIFAGFDAARWDFCIGFHSFSAFYSVSSRDARLINASALHFVLDTTLTCVLYRFMAVAASLNPEDEELEQEEQSQKHTRHKQDRNWAGRSPIDLCIPVLLRSNLVYSLSVISDFVGRRRVQ